MKNHNTFILPISNREKINGWNDEFLEIDFFDVALININLESINYTVTRESNNLVIKSTIDDNPVNVGFALLMLGKLFARRTCDIAGAKCR